MWHNNLFHAASSKHCKPARPWPRERKREKERETEREREREREREIEQAMRRERGRQIGRGRERERERERESGLIDNKLPFNICFEWQLVCKLLCLNLLHMVSTRVLEGSRIKIMYISLDIFPIYVICYLTYKRER